MVDGIHANRKKWEELCLSYQQAHQVSESSSLCLEVEEEEPSQCTDSTLTQSYEPVSVSTNLSTESIQKVESH